MTRSVRRRAGRARSSRSRSGPTRPPGRPRDGAPRPSHGARRRCSAASTRSSSGPSPTATARSSSSPAPGPARPRSITRRIAWLIATRRARPSEILGADVHRQGRRRDAGPGRPARAVRLHRHHDLDLPRLRRPADPRVRVRARPRRPTSGSCPARGRHLPARAAVRASSSSTTGRSATRPASWAPWPTHFSRLQGRGHRPGGLPRRGRPRGRPRRRCPPSSPGPRPTRTRPSRRRPPPSSRRRASSSWPVPTRATRRSSARPGFIDFGDQVEPRPPARCASRRPPGPSSGGATGTSSSTSSRTRTGPRPSSWTCSPSRHRNVTVVGDDDQSIYRFRGAAISNILEFRERCRARPRLVVLRRNYRSRAGILAASHRLIRFNDPDRLEVRAGIDKRLRAQRPEPPAGRRVPAVRHEPFATGSEEADWIAAEIAGRIAAGAAPRDHAVLVRSNAEADADPAQPERRGPPLALLRDVGAVCPARGPAAARASCGPIADLGSSVDLYALAASDVYGLGGDGPDRDRRRGPAAQPVAVGGPRGGRPPARASSGCRRDARRACSRLVADLRRLRRARPRATGRRGPVRVPARARASSPGSRGDRRPAADEALQNIARFFDIVRAQSALLADDRATFVVAPPPDARSRRATIRPTAELDPEAGRGRGPDRPQGQGPRVPDRVHGRARRRPLPGRRPARPAGDPDRAPRRTAPGRGDDHLREERRLFYVGMTRARDELILTHAADYGGRRARRVSPFVLEALDLPAAAVAGPARGRDPGRAAGRVRRRRAAGRGPRGAGSRRAAVAQLLPGRRLPDLPAPVQVRPRPAGPGRAAPLDRLRRRRSTGRSRSSTAGRPAAR